MQIQRSFVLDSALAVSLGSAICFFFGGAYEQGKAGGLGVPAEFMKAGDIWRTVAAGFDAVLASVIYFPFTFFGDRGTRWNVVTVVAIAAIVLVALLWFFRKSRLKIPLVIAWAITFVFSHIYVTTACETQDWVRRSEKCLLGQGCPAARVPHKVTYLMPDNEKRDRTGMFLSMNSEHLIMYANGGLLIVPVESIKEIATAQPLPAR